MNRSRAITLIVILALVGPALPVAAAFAHGIDVSVTPREGIEVIAAYADGSAMAGAQVAVFAPDDPAEPWLRGTADEDGRFYFVPDTTKPGTWDVQVRLAGHGDVVRVEVEPGGAVGTQGGGQTPLQQALMAACVIWGAIGTAFYFKGRAD